MNNLNQKEDISTWEKTGHLYLGLTLPDRNDDKSTFVIAHVKVLSSSLEASNRDWQHIRSFGNDINKRVPAMPHQSRIQRCI